MGNAMKTATLISAAILSITSIVSLAFFDAPFVVMLRNSLIAAVISLFVYFLWLRVSREYEKSFRQGLGR
ncbi:hypothetical protein HYU11_00620 [Candidatus Woesearchaeota archaeon]|nr:hypothetical protein [Candidatus Woesearchaeota archaeon]